MKIEKLNDNQIRCTLTSQDLASRKLKLSELAYGTEKAKMLFHDMMSEANQQFGFNVDNSPLMVEAIPVAPDSLVLIITKVDDPQELDTRFSRFAPLGEDTAQHSAAAPETPHYSGADDILELLSKLHQSAQANKEKKDAGQTPKTDMAEVTSSDTESAEKENTLPVDLIRAFYFPTLDDVITCAKVLGNIYSCSNTLFKTEQDSAYILVVHQKGMEPSDFNKFCNMLSEYAMPEYFSTGSESFLAEHGTVISQGNALLNLSVL